MSRRKIEPDHRYRWDDPNLPFFHPKTGEPISPERVTRICQMQMETERNKAPHYSKDPSYWWRKNKDKRG